MLIVFTSGHGGLFVGSHQSYADTNSGFFPRRLCPPVTCTRRPAGGLILTTDPEKELPATWGAVIFRLSVTKHKYRVKKNVQGSSGRSVGMGSTQIRLFCGVWKPWYLVIFDQCYQDAFTCTRYSHGTKWSGLFPNLKPVFWVNTVYSLYSRQDL